VSPQESEQDFELNLNPNNIMKVLSEVFVDASGFVIDVGQHQMWAAQSIRLRSGQRFLTSGGLGAMGFALPASVGAAVAASGKWVTILGDGCLQLSSAELQTISQYKLPIAVCVINNSQHGMVAQFQEENMNGRLIGTRDGFSNPNFQELAKAYGFSAVYKIQHLEELRALNVLVNEWETGPIFIEFVVDSRAKALPKMSSES
jgi:acetolactate synthase-1/2/3 large subunit